MRNEDQARRNARESCVKEVIKHEQKMGNYISEDSARRYVNERADKIDKKKDWNLKD